MSVTQEQLQGAYCLTELLELMQADTEGDNDWTDLPTFGGEPIEDTTAVWSWDEHYKIVGTHSGDVNLAPRDECDACGGTVGICSCEYCMED